MTWEELVKKAKELGYKRGYTYINFDFVSKNGVIFWKGKRITISVGGLEREISISKDYEKMYQIMEALQ